MPKVIDAVHPDGRQCVGCECLYVWGWTFKSDYFQQGGIENPALVYTVAILTNWEQDLRTSTDRKMHNHRWQKGLKQWNWWPGTTQTHSPCRTGHDLISCFPQRERTQKGQPCLQPRKGISIESLTHSMKPFPLHRLNRKYELFYQRLCIIRNSPIVQCNHFSTSKSATLSRYTHTILCRNNLFLISVLGNATAGLCGYICSVFSWKPRGTSATAAQDSPAKFEKMLWTNQQWWTALFLVTLAHMHTL